MVLSAKSREKAATTLSCSFSRLWGLQMLCHSWCLISWSPRHLGESFECRAVNQVYIILHFKFATSVSTLFADSDRWIQDTCGQWYLEQNTCMCCLLPCMTYFTLQKLAGYVNNFNTSLLQLTTTKKGSERTSSNPASGNEKAAERFARTWLLQALSGCMQELRSRSCSLPPFHTQN